jgi:hypothetical protein
VGNLSSLSLVLGIGRAKRVTVSKGKTSVICGKHLFIFGSRRGCRGRLIDPELDDRVTPDELAAADVFRAAFSHPRKSASRFAEVLANPAVGYDRALLESLHI